MRERSRRPYSLLTAYATRAGMRMLVVVAALVTGAPLAVAMPKAIGSNCGSNWVDNEGGWILT